MPNFGELVEVAGVPVVLDDDTRLTTAAPVASAVGFINHGATASTARPTTGFASYIWKGTVQPSNMTADDMFWDVS